MEGLGPGGGGGRVSVGGWWVETHGVCTPCRAWKEACSPCKCQQLALPSAWELRIGALCMQPCLHAHAAPAGLRPGSSPGRRTPQSPAAAWRAARWSAAGRVSAPRSETPRTGAAWAQARPLRRPAASAGWRGRWLQISRKCWCTSVRLFLKFNEFDGAMLALPAHTQVQVCTRCYSNRWALGGAVQVRMQW